MDEKLKKILSDHELWLKSNGTKGAQAVLKMMDLSGQELPNLNLKKSIICGVDFQCAILNGSDFSESVIHRVNFGGAGLEETNFCRSHIDTVDMSAAYLNKARFDGSILDSIMFNNSILCGTSFEAVGLSNASFIGARCNEDTRLPRGNVMSTSFMGITGLPQTELYLTGKILNKSLSAYLCTHDYEYCRVSVPRDAVVLHVENNIYRTNRVTILKLGKRSYGWGKPEYKEGKTYRVSDFNLDNNIDVEMDAFIEHGIGFLFSLVKEDIKRLQEYLYRS